MRVVCPHCNAAYQLDDAKVPERGATVRCTKCKNGFPVRKAKAEPPPAAIPFAAAGAAPPPGSSGQGIPLPPPVPGRAAAARDPFAVPPPAPASIPLPAPTAFPDPSPFGAAPQASPFDAGPASPFDAGPASPFDAGPASPFDAGPASPFDAGPASPFDAGPASPFDAAPAPFTAGGSPFGGPPAQPVPPLVPPPDLSFGEVELGAEPPGHPLPTPQAPPPPPADDPFDLTPRPARPPPLPSPASPGDGDDLEMLFGEVPSRPARADPTGYQVRRRSGKIFGPFDEPQIVEMLSKGELLGNEDVSTDGVSYSPIGSVAAFGTALRKAAAAEPTAPRPAAPVVFGERMASSANVTEGRARRPLPRWAKLAAVALPVVLVLAAGVGAGFTRHGFFFARALRRGNPAALANLLTQARTALGRGDFPSARAGLDHAARAVATDPSSSEAVMIHAAAAATLELVHGAPPEALAQARKAADGLERAEKGEVTTLAARLAMSLCAVPAATTPAQETALEAAMAKRRPDPELVALLARSALARGDVARAAQQFEKLAGLEPGPRGPLGQAQAALLRKALPDARALLEKALFRDKELAAAHLELAALDLQAGELKQAEVRLQPLGAEAARARLAPAERARALALLGSIAAQDPARAAEADKWMEEAVASDPRDSVARVQLVLHRLRRNDPAGAVAVTEPVAQTAAHQPDLAGARIRALALAGRALDASQLADQALASSPGRIELLLGKAFALAIGGKPDEAKALYGDVLARDPETVEARVALARFALADGALDRAGDLLTAAVTKGPRDPAARSATGDLLVARGDAAGAEAAYRKALSLEPTHAPAEVGLARLALGRGDLAAARAGLASALTHDPRNPDILVEHATLLWKEGELGQAQASFEAALDVSPRHAQALSRLGAVLLQKGDTEGAVRRLTAASNEMPVLVEARLWLGRALLARGETPGAIVQLRTAVELSHNVENLVALGGAYERASSLQEALDAYKAAAVADPKSAEPQEKIGQLLAQNGRCDQAIPALQRAIELAPRSSGVRTTLAECTARQGKHEEAVKLYQALLKADPKAVQAYYLLARSLHESRGAAAALPYYERAAREDPANPMPHYYLAYAYKVKGQRARAIQEFKAFLDRKPEAPEKRDIEAEIEDLGGR